MFNVTEEIKKLSKYVINRTAIFTLASALALTTTGCGNNDTEVDNILDSGYVGLIDVEIRLLQRVDIDSSAFLEDFDHSHYVDLISSSNFTDSKLCHNENYLEKDITILGTLVNYLTEDEIILSKNGGGEFSIVHLTEIYARLRDEFENKGFAEEKVEEINKVGTIPFNTLVEGIDAKDIFIMAEVNGKDEVINYNVALYIDNYVNETPGLFDLFDNTFNIFPCYKSGEEPTDEEKKQVLVNLNGRRVTYPIKINRFLEEKGLSYFINEKFSFEELERLESLLNEKDITKYNHQDVYVFLFEYSDVDIESSNDDMTVDKYYVLIPIESEYENLKKFKGTHVLNSATVVEYSTGSVLTYRDKLGTFSFDSDVTDKSLVLINDLLSSIGLEDYTKYEYSMGELIDINNYINSEQKVLVK